MKFSSTKLNNNVIKYQFTKQDSTPLTWKDFINLLKSGGQELTNALQHVNSQLKNAYFWECPPVSKNTLNRPFEFVVIKSESLDSITPNYSSFKNHVNNNEYSFTSKSGNTLIIPLPEKDEINKELDYKNLASFIQNVPDDSKQKTILWQEVARQLEANLADGQPRWLSTHGLGVSWLHIRIDKHPIYYSWSEYREFKENNEKNSPNGKNDKLPVSNQPNSNSTIIPPAEENPSPSSSNSSDPQPPDYSENLEPDKKPSDKNDSAIQQNKRDKAGQTNSDTSSSNKSNLPWIIGISGGILAISLSIFLWLRKKK